MIAVISGIALLFWYTPSVHQAHESLERLRASSWLGQLVRSVHRYSSDGCLFFVLLHACRIVCQRRFTGSRWLACAHERAHDFALDLQGLFFGKPG